MNQELSERFINMTKEEFLNEYAFNLFQYTEESKELIDDALLIKGISKEEIKAYRKLNLKSNVLEYNCIKCDEVLNLDENDLENGNFDCPECNFNQLINFPKSIINEVSNTSKKVLDESLKGLEGWLIVVGFALVVGTILDFKEVVQLFNYLDLYYSLLFFVIIFIDVTILYCFFKKLKIFPNYFVLRNVLLILIEITLSEFSSSSVGYIIGLTAWILYILNSKRVKATFIEANWNSSLNESKSESLKNYKQPIDNKDKPVVENIDNLKICSGCQLSVEESFEFCPKCGNNLKINICKKCGEVLEEGFEFCPKCGTKY